MTNYVWRDLLMLSAVDPRVWIGVMGVIGGAALPAALGPAHRSARVDPAVVLRAQ